MPEPLPQNRMLAIDFVGGAVGFRLKSGEGRHQPLPRALGLAKNPHARIVDATAGMGRDAFFLASIGAHVTLVERSPEVHAALAAAMERARAHGPEMAGIIGRMTLIEGDSKTLLPTLAPETVLIDPMHPPRAKTALVKKGMRDLRDIVGADPDAAGLIAVALATASRRVVVKWPRRAALPDGLPRPAHSLAGKTIRYDVFVLS